MICFLKLIIMTNFAHPIEFIHSADSRTRPEHRSRLVSALGFLARKKVEFSEANTPDTIESIAAVFDAYMHDEVAAPPQVEMEARLLKFIEAQPKGIYDTRDITAALGVCFENRMNPFRPGVSLDDIVETSDSLRDTWYVSHRSEISEAISANRVDQD